MFKKYLASLREGQLWVAGPDGSQERFGDPTSALRADLRIRHPRFFRRVLLGGEIGFGESYVAGEWESEDPPALLRLALMNRSLWKQVNRFAVWERWKFRWASRKRLNTPAGSAENIRRHYDLGNEFFRCILDDRMMYSCAVFDSENLTLEEAQMAKIRRVIRKIGLAAGDHVLDLGSGWGGWAMEAARLTGCLVTAVTLSKAQYEWTRARVQEAGLAALVTPVWGDYREVRGTFDHLVSLEMVEAVGEEFIGEFFRTADRLLKPDGHLLIQTTVVPDDRFEAYRREGGWLRKHVFPGGWFPSLAVLKEAMARHGRFVVEEVESLGRHFPPTLREWRRRLHLHRDVIFALGYDETLFRTWDYYLSLAEASFATGALDVLQLTCGRT